MRVFNKPLFIGCLVVVPIIYYILSLALHGHNASNVHKPGIEQLNLDAAIVKTKATSNGYLIPPDTELEKLSNVELAHIYWRYVNTIQILCRDQGRLGSLRDGGKETCLDNDFLLKKPCLVYSFGSNFQFDFELAVVRAYRCKVHTFDPTIEITAKTKWRIPKMITFHQLGFAGHDHITEDQNYEMATLETIQKRLNHTNRTVDLLKIDIEGWEWPALDKAIKSGIIQSVKQLQIEFHYEYSLYDNLGMDKLQVLRGLYDTGFRIFMRERNLIHVDALTSEYANMYTPLVELSLINIHYLKE